jgi:hypothetical protein
MDVSDPQPSSFPPPGAQPIWGSYSGSGQTMAAGPSPARSSSPSPLLTLLSGGEPLEPISRRLLQAAGFLSFLLIAVLANSFLQSSEQNPLNPIAAAAERTQTEPGARFTMKARYTSAGLPPMVAHGRGAYNSETGLSEATMRLASSEVGRFELEMVGDESSFYMRSKETMGSLPEGKEWMKVDPLLSGGEEELMLAGGDADGSLQVLGSVSDGVRKLGRENVRGEATQRYRATLDLADIAGYLRDEGQDDLAELYEKYAVVNPADQTVEVWIDRKEIVRRMRMVMVLPSEAGQAPVTMDMRIELFDFGAQPEVTLPDEDVVYDMTPLLEEQLDAVETD